MKNKLGPTYNYLYGNYWVLWYYLSNSYSIIDPRFKQALDLFLKSNSKSSFKKKIKSKNANALAENIYRDIKDYLIACNTKLETETTYNESFIADFREIQKSYKINNKIIKVFFDSELIQKLIHPALAHLQYDNLEISHTIFDIFIKNEYLWLFKNKSCLLKIPKKDYHFLRGKFIMHILCEIYEKEESDWLGTFHGSTITDDKTSILFIGESGSGKSTLSSILVANGYYLLADDVSPMLAKNTSIYHNPNGISLKDGATDVLKPLIDNFEDIPITEFNTSKGPLRYFASPKPPNIHYLCKSIVLVNYAPNAKTELLEISVKEILETLIPESWLSPLPEHAETFLEWLNTIKFYRLTYSNNHEMTNIISDVFTEQSN